MNTIKLHIRFIVNKRRLNSTGYSPIKCRLTYNKNRKDFSTGLKVNPNYWDQSKQRLLDQSDQEEMINMQLSLIENKISKAWDLIQRFSEDIDFTTAKAALEIVSVLDVV